MRTGDSVIQNRYSMQGRCFVGGIRSTACLVESDSLHSIPLSRCEKKTKEVC